LDTAGIDSALENVRLSVHNEDVPRAFATVDPSLAVLEEAYEEREAAKVCSACGASGLVSTPRLQVFAATSLIAIGMGVAVGLTDLAFFAIAAAGMYFLIADRYRCLACGNTTA